MRREESPVAYLAAVLILTQVEALTSEIEELSATFAKVTEAPPEEQTQKFQVSVRLTPGDSKIWQRRGTQENSAWPVVMEFQSH